MDNFVFHLLMATPPADGAAPGPGSFLSGIVPFVVIIGIFYFLIIRPQSKKRKETESMIAALKKGDKVVTIGGLHGIVQSVKDTTLIIKADDNVKLEFLRSAISTVLTQAKEEKIEDKGEEKEEEGKSSDNEG